MSWFRFRRSKLLAALLLVATFGLGSALTVGTDQPATPATNAPGAGTRSGVQSGSDDSKVADEELADATDDSSTGSGSDDDPTVDDPTRRNEQSDLRFRDGYRHAYSLIHTRHDYLRAIDALHALKRGHNPDVATLLGYASRRLGRYDDAKFWYEEALAADPRHARTWSYYGIWHAEQGNVLKAEAHLERVRVICGTAECREYRELQAAIERARSS